MSKHTICFLTQTDYYNKTTIQAGVRAAAQDLNINLLNLGGNISGIYFKFGEQKKLIQTMLDKFSFDGLVFQTDFLGMSGITAEEDEIFDILGSHKNVPIVCIGKIQKKIPYVNLNGYKYLSEMMRHLYDIHGCRKIVYVSSINEDDRTEAYLDFMKEKGLETGPYHLTSRDMASAGEIMENRADFILKEIFVHRKIQPDVIMSMYSYEAYLVLEGLKKLGIQVPQDVKLVSWEDAPLGRYSQPSITAIEYPFFELGYQGIKILKNILDGKKVPLRTEVPGIFRIRQSCGCKTMGLQLITDSRESLVTDLQDPGLQVLKSNFDNFEKYYQKELFDKVKKIEDVYSIYEKILSLRQQIVSLPDINMDTLIHTDSQTMRAGVMSLQNMEKIIGGMEIIKNFIEINLQDLSRNILASFKMEDILKYFEQTLIQLDITDCYLFLFPESSKDVSCQNMIYAFRNGSRQVLKNYPKSDIRTLIPKQLLFGKASKSYLIHLLTIQNRFLGFVIYSQGPSDDKIYQAITNLMSTALLTILNLERLKKAQNKIIMQDKALQENNLKLLELDTLKNNFIANITHDFRSPLMIIRNNSDLGIKYDSEHDFNAIRKRYNIISETSLKLKNSIDRLLDLSKMDAQGVKINVKRVRICAFLKDLVDFYKSAVVITSIVIRHKIPLGEVNNFYTDPDKLEEVLSNIISNGIKFVDPLKGEICVSLVEKPRSIQIRVSDNGAGIPQDKLESIFNRFEQGGAGLDSRYKGTGIGLSFARQLAGFLKGKLHAESAGLNKGATFVLELPKGKSAFRPEDWGTGTVSETISTRRKVMHQLVDIDLKEKFQTKNVVVMISDPNKSKEFDYQKGVILLIDDNKSILDIELEYLQNAGYKNFILAFDGKQGLDAVYQYHPDLILCDFNMPKMKGDQFHDELADNPEFKKIPFIFMTAVSDRQVILERRRKGALAFLSKPVDEPDLVLSVELHMKKYMEHKAMLYQASTDELTGLNIRRMLMKLYQSRISLRNYSHLSVIFFDLDGFKSLNDTYGHQWGDQVLISVGKLVQSTLRIYDIVGRYGGDEFVAILPDTPLDKAVIVAEKLRAGIEKLEFKFNKQKIHVRVSFGVSSLIDHAPVLESRLDIKSLKNLYHVINAEKVNWDELNKKKAEVGEALVKLADEALYMAKNTQCRQCGFITEKSRLFVTGKCPKCKSSDLELGGNRVVAFPNKDLQK